MSGRSCSGSAQTSPPCASRSGSRTRRGPSSAGGPGDVFHFNSMEWDPDPQAGDGIVMSFRHLDAVYRINRATGAQHDRTTHQRRQLGGDPRRPVLVDLES